MNILHHIRSRCWLIALAAWLAFGGSAQAQRHIATFQSVLGHPYNIFGDYARPSDVGPQRVLDIPSLASGVAAQMTKDVSFTKLEGTETERYSGESLQEMSSAFKLALGVDVDVPLMMDVFAKFGLANSSSSSAQTAYLRYEIQEQILMASLKVPGGRLNSLRKYLAESILKDLDTLKFDDEEGWQRFFDRYAYVITGAIFGGKITLNSSTVMKEGQTVSEIVAGAETAFALAAGNKIGGGGSHEQEESKDYFLTNSVLTVSSWGGDKVERPQALEDLYKIDTWRETVASQIELIAFPKDGLTPIWEFAANAQRKALVQKAFERYAMSQGGWAVTVFTECGYRGNQATLKAGRYTARDLDALGVGSDTISSIKIDPHFKIVVYDGENLEYHLSNWTPPANLDLSCLKGEWNDRISSIEIVKK